MPRRGFRKALALVTLPVVRDMRRSSLQRRSLPHASWASTSLRTPCVWRGVMQPTAGVEARVEFRLGSLDKPIGDREYHLARLFDCVHDFADPVRALRNVCTALKPGGSGLIQELNVGEALADNLNPFGAFIYTVSTLHCMSQSLGSKGVGLGAAMPPSVLRRMVLDTGFVSCDRMSLKHPLYALYEART